MSNPKYYQQVQRVLVGVLALNWLVALLKLVAGTLAHSASMVADGVHSLSDGSSNIIGLLGMRIASRPKDFDHPYGHKKYETYASMFIAGLLFFACFHLLGSAFSRLGKPVVPQIHWWSFVVMGVTMGINAFVMVYERRKGVALGSDILISDAYHTRSDILTSFSVLVALVAIRKGYPMFDAVATVVIAFFIASSAIEIIRRSSAVLCDTAVIDPELIQGVALTIPGVRKCHRVRSRGRLDDVHVDLHILLDDQIPLVGAHSLGNRIEEAICRRFPGVTDVVVHLEPLSSDGEDERTVAGAL